jgi:dUTP pyrophosphatase
MKLKIKVKRINKNITLPEVIEGGDWIDLKASETVTLKAPQAGVLKRHRGKDAEESHRDVTFDMTLIPLGVAIELPKGFEAVVLARSSTPKKFGVITANSEGVIDNTYCGNNDEWKYPALAIKDTTINEGDRICQFRIQLSQKATVWQKLKWLLSSGVKIVEVESLSGANRNGFGSTGVK